MGLALSPLSGAPHDSDGTGVSGGVSDPVGDNGGGAGDSGE